MSGKLGVSVDFLRKLILALLKQSGLLTVDMEEGTAENKDPKAVFYLNRMSESDGIIKIPFEAWKAIHLAGNIIISEFSFSEEGFIFFNFRTDDFLVNSAIWLLNILPKEMIHAAGDKYKIDLKPHLPFLNDKLFRITEVSIKDGLEVCFE